MFRVTYYAVFAVASLGLAGCAGTWDTLTSKRFRDDPFTTVQHMVAPEDPMMVLRADPPRDGDERAAAMRRLKEPLKNKGTQADQDEILEVLGWHSRSDASPVLRMEAISALGRFEDPRAAGLLIAAYQHAHGRKAADPAPRPVESPIVQTGASAGRNPTRTSIERFPITGPTGYPPEWVTSIRCRTLDALALTHRPEAAQFLASVAGATGPDIAVEGSEDREVRLAAVRGLGKCRQPESVVALSQVLNAEFDKQDTAIIGRTHEGLVRLTGKKLPADPQKWGEVVQAGVVLAPQPTWWDDTIDEAIQWIKN